MSSRFPLLIACTISGRPSTGTRTAILEKVVTQLFSVPDQDTKHGSLPSSPSGSSYLSVRMLGQLVQVNLGLLIVGIKRERSLEKNSCLDCFSQVGQNGSVPSIGPSILRIQGETFTIRFRSIPQTPAVLIERGQRGLSVILPRSQLCASFQLHFCRFEFLFPFQYSAQNGMGSPVVRVQFQCSTRVFLCRFELLGIIGNKREPTIRRGVMGIDLQALSVEFDSFTWCWFARASDHLRQVVHAFVIQWVQFQSAP